MSLISNQRDCMAAIISYLTDVQGYINDPGASLASFETYLTDINETELEEYLLNNMSTTPSYMESAVAEVKNFLASWKRDLSMRSMDRASFFTDHESNLQNDVAYLRDLRELQSQYIRGRTPQQRS